MTNKIVEQEIAEDLRGLLKRGIAELKGISKSDPFETSEMVKLEKLTRIYSILMADTRETVKHGLLAGLSDEEIDELAEEL